MDDATAALIRFLSGDTSGMKCTVCSARAGACDCWSRCECGWFFRKGGACRNSIHGTAPVSTTQLSEDASARP